MENGFITLSFLRVLLFGVCCLCESVPGMYVFSDSLVDVGNNNYLPLPAARADFPHNAVDFPTGEATGRFNNGKNAVDFLGSFSFSDAVNYLGNLSGKGGITIGTSFLPPAINTIPGHKKTFCLRLPIPLFLLEL
ncbi:GDSL esterase/lipase At4g16220-like [Bidens hawaiensis]|uniref:GDSL esterase/lipase At4g16220-like n=1 Tax=Bidens hawaiensis TaxID=980011 RepID=UPI004049CC07